MTYIRKIILFSSSLIIVLFFCFSSVSCGQILTVEEKETFRNIADPMTENYFVSINESDYDSFSKDFDDGMKKAITKDNFAQSVCTIKDEIGSYMPGSIKFVTMAIEKGYTSVYYEANFSKKNNIKIKMVFDKINDEYKISGQWFQ